MICFSVMSLLNWLKNYSSLEIHFIKGNHDRIAINDLKLNNVSIYDNGFMLNPFEFVHTPDAVNDNFTISGHLHPGIRIRSRARPGITLPCFKLTQSHLILPAFSMFTGLAAEKKTKNNQYFAFTDTSFFEF